MNLPFPLPEFPELSSVALSIIGTIILMGVIFYFREPVYYLLTQFLETKPRFFRVIGELVSLFDAYIKGNGIYFLMSLIGVSIMPTPSDSVLVLTFLVFLLRHWVYPSAFKSLGTKSVRDDTSFFMDFFVRGVGIYQGLLFSLM